jgi:hypothetical protein
MTKQRSYLFNKFAQNSLGGPVYPCTHKRRSLRRLPRTGYQHNVFVMPRALGCFLAVLICASVASLTWPARAEILPPAPTHCCGHVSVIPSHASPDRGCPMSPLQQKQCCAACALALTLFLAANSSFIPSATSEGNVGDGAIRVSGRADRPPVPPPRFPSV